MATSEARGPRREETPTNLRRNRLTNPTPVGCCSASRIVDRHELKAVAGLTGRS